MRIVLGYHEKKAGRIHIHEAYIYISSTDMSPPSSSERSRLSIEQIQGRGGQGKKICCTTCVVQHGCDIDQVKNVRLWERKYDGYRKYFRVFVNMNPECKLSWLLDLILIFMCFFGVE